MDSITDSLEDLVSNIDDLESALQPLLSQALSASTSRLPLLDKSKLYILTTYALESILFSYLRLHGVSATSHPVYQELNRVKEYFAKIKSAEEIGAGGSARKVGLDKNAAGRFIKAGLSGNEKYDQERKEREAAQRVGAKRKLDALSGAAVGMGTHTRFDGSAKKIKSEEEEVRVKVVKAEDVEDESDVEEELYGVQKKSGEKKRGHGRTAEALGAAPEGGEESSAGGEKKRKKKGKNTGKKSGKETSEVP